jgi:hypothetical protein
MATKAKATSKAVRPKPYPIFVRALEEALEKAAEDADLRNEETFCKRATEVILKEIHKVFDFNDQPTGKTMTAKPAVVMERAIKEGVGWGWYHAYKHTDEPSKEYLLNYIYEDIMNAVCELFDFDD